MQFRSMILLWVGTLLASSSLVAVSQERPRTDAGQNQAPQQPGGSTGGTEGAVAGSPRTGSARPGRRSGRYETSTPGTV